MNRRQIWGWLIIGVGIALIIFSMHSMHEFAKSRGLSLEFKQFFTQNPLWNPIIKFFGGTPQVKPPAHDVPALITQTIGIVLVVVGGITAFISRRNKV
jgi:hypothetical protein